MMRILLLALLACVASDAQEFEVVSIKPNKSLSGGSSSHTNQGMLRGENLSLRSLILRAHDLKDYQIEGPDWLASEHFDITAKFSEALPKDRAKYKAGFQSMMQKMLADRFKLEAHRGQKTLGVYVLVVAKNGPKFQVSSADGSSSNSNNTHYTGTGISMDQFAGYLSDRADLPVIDKTELKASYDLKLDWVPESRHPEKGDSDTTSGPILVDALQEQLGLKLERRKEPIEILVVEHAERVPTEN